MKPAQSTLVPAPLPSRADVLLRLHADTRLTQAYR